jgi:HEAT repeat protein
MKKMPSESTEKLIESLYARKGLRDRFLRTSPTVEVIRQIADSGEPAAIPDLLPILLVGDKKQIEACAQAIHRLLQQLTPADFVHFDELVRQGYADWRVRREPWYVMKANEVNHLANMGETAVSILGIAGCHSNGYVREAAVQQLGNIETGAELPFLFIRANDWVPEIRSSAQAFLLCRIRSDYADRLMVWLPLALRLRDVRRNDNSRIIETVQKLFENPEAREALTTGFDSQDRVARRFCFNIALNLNEPDAVNVLRRALADTDPQVRKAAAGRLLTIAPTPESKDLLIQARHNGSIAVRREALHIFAEKFQDEVDHEFESALLDSNIAIREEAQFYFQRAGTLDLRAYYSRMLDTPSRQLLCAAIAGLGETGLPKDSELVRRFLTDNSSRVRAVALRAVARLNPDAYMDEFVLALNDSSGKVTREAVRALGKKANAVGGQRLWELFKACPYRNGKRSVLFLLARISKWDSIVFLIQSLVDQDPSVIELSRRYIVRWFARYNRSFVSPTSEQLLKLKNVLSNCNLLLSADAQRQLDLLLKSF